MGFNYLFNRYCQEIYDKKKKNSDVLEIITLISVLVLVVVSIVSIFIDLLCKARIISVPSDCFYCVTLFCALISILLLVVKVVLDKFNTKIKDSEHDKIDCNKEEFDKYQKNLKNFLSRMEIPYKDEKKIKYLLEYYKYKREILRAPGFEKDFLTTCIIPIVSSLVAPVISLVFEDKVQIEYFYIFLVVLLLFMIAVGVPTLIPTIISFNSIAKYDCFIKDLSELIVYPVGYSKPDNRCDNKSRKKYWRLKVCLKSEKTK